MTENLYSYILQNYKLIEKNYNYSSQLKKNVLESFKIKTISPKKNHFTVTELCDPLGSYLKRKYPLITDVNPERKKIMDIGSLIHKNAERWVEKIDNTALVEFYFDGLLKGFNVSGKFDAKIGDSFIDFKSKVDIPKTIEEAIQKYPQDFEQIVMYSVIDILSPRTNYLIFISQNDPLELKSFKITITNEKDAENFLRERIDLYSEVLAGERKPDELGSCRYCPNNPETCPYYQIGKCEGWYLLAKKECGVLNFIKIEEEDILKNKLKDIIKQEGLKKTSLISLSNLIWQKKYILSVISDKDIEFKYDESQKRNQGFIERITFELNKDQSKTNQTEPKPHNFEDIFKYKSRFFNLKNMQYPEGVWTPFLVYSSSTINSEGLEKPSDYKIVELGLLLAINNLKEGLIFQYYPNLNNECRVFRIEYSFFIPKVQEKIKKILEYLKKPNLTELSELDNCPFGCEKCLFNKECKK
jgi:hypothetical protein